MPSISIIKYRNIMNSPKTPTRQVSNNQDFQDSQKKLNQREGGFIKNNDPDAKQAFPSIRISSGAVFTEEVKLVLKQKIRALRKKKDIINKVWGSERGPKRIMKKCFSRRKNLADPTQQYNEQSEQVDEEEFQNTLNDFRIKGEIMNQDQSTGSNLADFSSDGKSLRAKNNPFVASNLIIFPVGKERKFYARMTRKHSGLKYFLPQFELKDDKQNISILCKKTGPFSFQFFNINKEWQNEASSNIGRMVSNFSGSQLNLYMNYKHNDKIEERLICTIEYTNSYFDVGKPRSIKVFLLKWGQVNLQDYTYSKVTNLEKLISNRDDDYSVQSFQSMEPTYSKKQKMYKLDFHGRAQKSSIKNFILESPQHRGREYFLFGKFQQNIFNIDFMHPFSYVTAFAVAVSSFNGKIICQ